MEFLMLVMLSVIAVNIAIIGENLKQMNNKMKGEE